MENVAEIEGMIAARDGLAVDNNPYPEHDSCFQAWRKGFLYIAEGSK